MNRFSGSGDNESKIQNLCFISTPIPLRPINRSKYRVPYLPRFQVFGRFAQPPAFRSWLHDKELKGIRRFSKDPGRQTRLRNRILRRRIPVHLYSCRSSLKSHPKQAGVESHLEIQDKTDQKSNCRADEIRTAQQLLFVSRDSVSPNFRLRYGLTRERSHR